MTNAGNRRRISQVERASAPIRIDARSAKVVICVIGAEKAKNIFRNSAVAVRTFHYLKLIDSPDVPVPWMSWPLSHATES